MQICKTYLYIIIIISWHICKYLLLLKIIINTNMQRCKMYYYYCFFSMFILDVLRVYFIFFIYKAFTVHIVSNFRRSQMIEQQHTTETFKTSILIFSVWLGWCDLSQVKHKTTGHPCFTWLSHAFVVSARHVCIFNPWPNAYRYQNVDRRCLSRDLSEEERAGSFSCLCLTLSL